MMRAQIMPGHLLNVSLRLLGVCGVGRYRGTRPSPVLWVPAAAVAIAMVLPVIYLGERALDGGSQTAQLLFRMRTAEILLRSALLIAVVTALSVLFAVPIAWLTVRSDLPLRRFWAVATVLPLVIPTYVGAFLLLAGLGPRGLLQGLLESAFGIGQIPDIAGLPGAALSISLLSYPYVMLSVRAALWGLDPSLEEMSRVLGNGKWATLWRVTLPQLRPSVAAGSLLVALYALSDFGAVSLMRYETFTWAIYLQYETAFDRSLAAGLSLVLAMAALVLVIIEAKARGRAQYFRSTPGNAQSPHVFRLGRFRWPAFGFVAVVFSFSLAAPVAILIFWAVRGISAGEPLRILWAAAFNSFSVSALAALVAIVAAVPIVVLTTRYPSWQSRLLEKLAFTGYALPGIAVALALIFFSTRFAAPVYQTLFLLVFAYVVLFFPQAMGAIRSSYLQVNPQLGEAARGLGRRPLNVLLRISLPLVAPGVFSGAVLVFLTAMKELPATLLLSPTGFRTLAGSIWSAAEEAYFAQAAVPALLLVAISALATSLMIVNESKVRQ